VTASAIRGLVRSAGIAPSTLLWREGFADWKPVSQIETFNRPTGDEWTLP